MWDSWVPDTQKSYLFPGHWKVLKNTSKRQKIWDLMFFSQQTIYLAMVSHDMVKHKNTGGWILEGRMNFYQLERVLF